jgi:tetratricopeptide (TPR) repeat protein
MKRLLSIILVIFLVSGCGLLVQENILDAREDLKDSQFKDALKSLDSVESDVKDMTPDQKGEYYILKARALHGLERYEEAIYCLNAILKHNPDSLFEAQAKALLTRWNEYK